MGIDFSPRSAGAKLVQKHLSGGAAKVVKKAIAGPRFRSQLAEARRGFAEHGNRYPVQTLFVAGLPKSGTTWLEGMLSSLEGFHDVMLPEAVTHEQRFGESITFELPDDTFQRLERSLSVLKLHIQGSPQTVRVLEDNAVPYVALWRDLRDVAVSHSFYVQKTPWHPEHEAYKDRPIGDCLAHFADTLLEKNVQWVLSWKAQQASPLCLVATYEEMLENAEGVLLRVLKHYRIPDADALAPRLVEANKFERLSQGGKEGSGFFRKGQAGDWVNHMPPALASGYEDAMSRLA